MFISASQFNYALQQHLSYGTVRNRNGEFVSASLERRSISVHSPGRARLILRFPSSTPPGEGLSLRLFHLVVLPAHCLRREAPGHQRLPEMNVRD